MKKNVYVGNLSSVTSVAGAYNAEKQLNVKNMKDWRDIAGDWRVK